MRKIFWNAYKAYNSEHLHNGHTVIPLRDNDTRMIDQGKVTFLMRNSSGICQINEGFG